MKRIERIEYYEAVMEKIEQAQKKLAEALAEYEAANSLCDELAAYLASKQWKRDFEADEKGLLPKDLKRGVLSEDGAYNVLEAYRAELSEMLEAAARMI